MAKAGLRFEITGMSCAGCAGRAERALSAVPGVAQSNVNLADHTARVTGDVTPKALADALGAAGYPAATETVHLSIDGMSCASCSARVEKALTAEPGVLDATVNLATETATVRHLGGAVDLAALTEAVRKAGYEARAEDRSGPTTDVHEDAQARLWRDTLIAGALTLPVFLVEMGGHLVPAVHHAVTGLVGQSVWWFVQFLLISAVLFGPGRRFLSIGLPLLARGTPDMNSLVALGTLSAWSYSSVALFAPGLLPEDARAVYFEAAGVIVTLILLGRWLEARAKGRTGEAIRKLMALRPDVARVERDGEVVELPAEALRAGDILHLRPGERVAVDGEVIEGRSYIDESLVTGEPVPVEKSLGDSVTGGTINGSGALRFRATAVGRDTVLARIIAMVQDAQGAKLPIQALADKVVLWFVPAIIAIALVTVAVWLAVGPSPALSHALVAGVSVLIIACPCAMGLATPTSIMVGTGRAAELGVLFRRGDALQRLAEVLVMAFDKTGTLTRGAPALVARHGADGVDTDAVLRLTAAVERHSEHPIARAIEAAASGPLPTVENFEALPGDGLRARVEGREVLIGTARLMAEKGMALDSLRDAMTEVESRGQTPVLVAMDGAAAALFAVADPIKPTSRDAVASLRRAGVKVAMITGDTPASARAIAAELGIDHVEAGVRPDGKVAAIERL